MKLKRTVGLYKIVKFNKRRVPNKNEGGEDFPKFNKAYPLAADQSMCDMYLFSCCVSIIFGSRSKDYKTNW